MSINLQNNIFIRCKSKEELDVEIEVNRPLCTPSDTLSFITLNEYSQLIYLNRNSSEIIYAFRNKALEYTDELYHHLFSGYITHSSRILKLMCSPEKPLTPADRELENNIYKNVGILLSIAEQPTSEISLMYEYFINTIVQEWDTLNSNRFAQVLMSTKMQSLDLHLSCTKMYIDKHIDSFNQFVNDSKLDCYPSTNKLNILEAAMFNLSNLTERLLLLSPKDSNRIGLEITIETLIKPVFEYAAKVYFQVSEEEYCVRFDIFIYAAIIKSGLAKTNALWSDETKISMDNSFNKILNIGFGKSYNSLSKVYDTLEIEEGYAYWHSAISKESEDSLLLPEYN